MSWMQKSVLLLAKRFKRVQPQDMLAGAHITIKSQKVKERVGDTYSQMSGKYSSLVGLFAVVLKHFALKWFNKL